MEYKIIRSNRRTLSLEVTPGAVIVRVPLYATDEEIGAFISKHKRWIEIHTKKVREKTAALENEECLTSEEIKALAEKACKIIPERVRYYAPLVGVTYGRITIRNQKTRWGSCSKAGNLNFNCLLMLAPPEVLDSVVVHELCHRKQMNHSDKFYKEVLRVFPEYKKWNGWLKENGSRLMAQSRRVG